MGENMGSVMMSPGYRACVGTRVNASRMLLLALALCLGVMPLAGWADEATPAAACDLPARRLDEVTALMATPAPPEPERSGVLPMGEPLRPGEQILLEATVHRFIACTNAGEPLRLFSLYTDRYLQRVLTAESSPVQGGQHDALATPVVAEPGNSAELVEITGGRRMADGRLGALVTIAVPSIPQSQTRFFVFLPVGDSLLIDDISGELP